MKLSSDQKSVLVLAVPVATVAIFTRSANFFVYLAVIAIWFWCVRDRKKSGQPAAVLSAPPASREGFGVNSDQKSVLILAGFVLFGALYGGAQNLFTMPVIVILAALAVWFYGVRTKNKPITPPPLPRS